MHSAILIIWAVKERTASTDRLKEPNHPFFSSSSSTSRETLKVQNHRFDLLRPSVPDTTDERKVLKTKLTNIFQHLGLAKRYNSIDESVEDTGRKLTFRTPHIENRWANDNLWRQNLKITGVKNSLGMLSACIYATYQTPLDRALAYPTGVLVKWIFFNTDWKNGKIINIKLKNKYFVRDMK